MSAKLREKFAAELVKELYRECPPVGNIVIEGRGEFVPIEKAIEAIRKMRDFGARAKPAAVKEPAPNIWAEWCDANRRAGRAYPLSVPKNLGAAREIGKAITDVGARAELFDRYLADKDRYLAAQGWPLCLLPGRAEAYRNAPVLAVKPQWEWTQEDWEQHFLDEQRAEALKKKAKKE